VADEVSPEAAARLVDPIAFDELDEVGGLVVVELVITDETELYGRGRDALLEIGRIEAEAVLVELDDIVVAGDVVRLCHEPSIPPR
jgi:hypothetical protein